MGEKRRTPPPIGWEGAFCVGLLHVEFDHLLQLAVINLNLDLQLRLTPIEAKLDLIRLLITLVQHPHRININRSQIQNPIHHLNRDTAVRRHINRIHPIGNHDVAVIIVVIVIVIVIVIVVSSSS